MGATGLFVRKLEKKHGTICRNTVYHKTNRAKSGLPGPKRRAPNGVIYGMQNTVIDNSVSQKPWQHGPNYNKPNLSGHIIDLATHIDHDGSLIYTRLRSGQIIRTKNLNKKLAL